MLIEELIRLGRPLVEGGLNEWETLEIITDVNDPRARNFLRHVLVAELPQEDSGEPAVWSLKLVTDLETTEGEKVTRVAVERAVGCPFSLPTGGNPLNPQGRYGIPVYPCWDPHLRAFRESSAGVRAFLDGRLVRTPGIELSEELLTTLCCRIHEEVRQRFGDSDEKRLGVLVLARCAPDGFYSYGRQSGSATNLGKSPLASAAYVEPNLPKILEAVWAARLEEGAEMGDREAGVCTMSGAEGRVVSSYCKAWPWAFPTWTCPVPHGGDTGLLIESFALSADAYRALTMGASVFSRLTKKLRHFIVSEVFSPTADQPAREIAQKRGANDLASIYGAVFVLPVEDRLLAGPSARTFARRTLGRTKLRPAGATAAGRQLEAVTGFECFVDGLDGDDYRLTLVYFSGEPSRGDIHLRAYIQDVLPSVAARLGDLAADSARAAHDLFLIVHLAEKRLEYLLRCYGSVPYLLARGYGGPHLWTQLEQALQGRPLGLRRVIANCAARMASLVRHFPDSRFNLAEEAVFYLCCREFIREYNVGRTLAPEEEGMPMREWRVLLRAVEREPIEELRFESVAELGFACGAVVHRFAVWYWTTTKASGEAKDYLKHRVLTFGADLSPEVVWKTGLGNMLNVAARVTQQSKKRLPRWFENRVGVVLAELSQRQDKIRSNRDEFMTAFWAGYSLQGYDRPKNPKSDSGKKETINGGES